MTVRLKFYEMSVKKELRMLYLEDDENHIKACIDRMIDAINKAERTQDVTRPTSLKWMIEGLAGAVAMFGHTLPDRMENYIEKFMSAYSRLSFTE